MSVAPCTWHQKSVYNLVKCPSKMGILIATLLLALTPQTSLAFINCVDLMNLFTRKFPFWGATAQEVSKKPLNASPVIAKLRTVRSKLPYQLASEASQTGATIESGRSYSPKLRQELENATKEGLSLLKRFKEGDFSRGPGKDPMGIPIWDFMPLFYDIVSAYWDSLGIAHRVFYYDHGRLSVPIVEVIPQMSGHILNQRAFQLKKDIGAKIWLEHSTWNNSPAAFDQVQLAVHAPMELIIHPSESLDVLIHEGWGHGKTQADARAGTSNPLYGGVRTINGGPILPEEIEVQPGYYLDSGSYERSFSFDEIYAYRIHIEHLLEEYNLAPTAAKHKLMEKIVNYSGYGYLVSYRTARLLGLFISETSNSTGQPIPASIGQGAGVISPKLQEVEMVADSLNMSVHTLIPVNSNLKSNYLDQLRETQNEAARWENWFLDKIRIFFPTARLADKKGRIPEDHNGPEKNW